MELERIDRFGRSGGRGLISQYAINVHYREEILLSDGFRRTATVGRDTLARLVDKRS